MDKQIIDSFWRSRAADGQGRWTEEVMCEFEISMLTPHIRPSTRMLDLGSGDATLSTRLLAQASALTVVEKQAAFLERIANSPKIVKYCCDIADFPYPDNYDLVLLFGVVTHLEVEEEIRIYRQIASCLVAEGVFVVKNQVSRSTELVIDRFSEQLACRYVGRYPEAQRQRELLESHFGKVTPVRYPENFNKWPETEHMLFICSCPLVADRGDEGNAR